MAITFGDNQYGKAEVRLVHITRDGDRHQIKDLNVSTALRGDFADAAPDRRQRQGRRHRHAEEHRLRLRPAVRGGRDRGVRAPPGRPLRGRLRVGDRREDRASRSTAGTGSPSTAPSTGTRSPGPAAAPGPPSSPSTAPAGLGGVRPDRPGRAEVDRLGVLGLPARPVHHAGRDQDRILATAVTARWRYAGTDVDWAKSYADVRRILLESFAVKHSLALQQTLYSMGEQVLEAHPEVAEIRMSMPNKHHFLVDLSPFGLPNETRCTTRRTARTG